MRILPPERTRRALWVMYTRLTSSTLHKLYTLTLLLILLPLLILHLLAISNTSNAISKLSIILATANSTGDLVPTFSSEDGQSILRLCNPTSGGVDCQTLTSVASSTTPTTTPQQLGGTAGATSTSNSARVNAGVQSTSFVASDPTASTGGAIFSALPPTAAASALPTSQIPVPSSINGGLFLAAPPAPTSTSDPVSQAPSSGLTSTATTASSSLVIIANEPSPTALQNNSGSGSGNGQKKQNETANKNEDVGNKTDTDTNSASGQQDGSNTGQTKETKQTDTESTLLTLPTGVDLGVNIGIGGGKSTTSDIVSTSTGGALPTETGTGTTTSVEPANTDKGRKGENVVDSTTSSIEVSTLSTEATTSTSSIEIVTSTSTPTASSPGQGQEKDAVVQDSSAPPSTSETKSVTAFETSESESSSAVDSSTSTATASSTAVTTTSSSSTSAETLADSSTSTVTASSTAVIITSSSSTSAETSADSSTNTVTASSTAVITTSSSSTSAETSPSTTNTAAASTTTTTTTSSSSISAETSSSTTATSITTTSSSSSARTESPSSTTTDTSSSETGHEEQPSATATKDSSKSESAESLDISSTTGGKDSKPTESPELESQRSFRHQHSHSGSNSTSSKTKLTARALSATPITNSTTGALSGIDVTDLQDDGSNEVTHLGLVCAISMAFPRDQLLQDRIENLTMTAFYLMMLGAGLAAVLTSSPAHLLSLILCTVLSLGWTGTQLVRTNATHEQFSAFITRSACSGIDVLSNYWTEREKLEPTIVAINALALFLFTGLGVKLSGVFRGQSARIGNQRSPAMGTHVHKVVLMLRIAIPLGAFLVLSGMGIWTQIVFTSSSVAIVGGDSGVGVLRAFAVVSLVAVVPWAVVGWASLNTAEGKPSRVVEGEKRKWWGKRMAMGLFLGLNLLFLVGWMVTFASDVYRAFFLSWTFFAVLSVAAFFVLVGSLGAGVMCWMRFGREESNGDGDFLTEKPPRGNSSRPGRFSVGTIDSFDSPDVQSREVGLIPETHRWDYSNTAEKAWEPFERMDVRQSQFTSSDGRESTAFSYGLRSPAPPMPVPGGRAGGVGAGESGNGSEIALAL